MSRISQFLTFIVIILFLNSCINFSDDTTELKRKSLLSNTKVEASRMFDSTFESVPIVDEKVHNSFKIDSSLSVTEINLKVGKLIQYCLMPSSKDTALLKKSLVLCNLALYKESNNYAALKNKAAILKGLGKTKAQIKVLKEAISAYPSAVTISHIGFLYEKTGNIDSAYIYYKKSIQTYSKQIKISNSTNDIVNRAFLLYLLDEERGKVLIQGIIDANPNDEAVVLFEHIMLNFDRDKFINDF